MLLKMGMITDMENGSPDRNDKQHTDLVDQVTTLAATDSTVDDDMFVAIARALRGQDPITGDPAAPATVPVRTADMPHVHLDLATTRNHYGDFADDDLNLTGYDAPDPDDHVVYVGATGYTHAELPQVIAFLTAVYHAGAPTPDDDTD